MSTWNFIKKARDDFWIRWCDKYLHELQTQQKWHGSEDEIKINFMVLLMDKNLPCFQWRMGIVIEVHAGGDRAVRVASVKTAMHWSF